MKTTTATLIAAAAISAFGGVRTIELNDGDNAVTEIMLPSRCAKVVGYETMMLSSNDNGTASLSIGRTVTAKVSHVDIVRDVTTQQVVSVKSLANHYTVVANHYGEAGALADMQVSTFSNCYASTSKGMSHGEKGTSRITFTPGAGQATLEYPTNYTVRVEFFGNFWYTNFVWDASSTEMSLTSPATNYPIYRVGIMRPLPPVDILQTNSTEVTTVTTNRWTENASRTVSIPVTPSVATTNGYAYSAVAADTYVFAGDRLKATTPISTNAVGKVRVIIAE